MKDKDSVRIKKVTKDQDDNLIVVIIKYRWTECLWHSLYGFVTIIFIIPFLILAMKEQWLWGIASILLSLFFWMKAWLDANDQLKGRVYPELLEQYLLEKEKIESPFVFKRYNSSNNSISTISTLGVENIYMVEFMQEQLPMYIVKIHIDNP
jgi:hypothetical protein